MNSSSGHHNLTTASSSSDSGLSSTSSLEQFSTKFEPDQSKPRGRPRKQSADASTPVLDQASKKRGRPRKIEKTEEDMLTPAGPSGNDSGAGRRRKRYKGIVAILKKRSSGLTPKGANTQKTVVVTPISDDGKIQDGTSDVSAAMWSGDEHDENMSLLDLRKKIVGANGTSQQIVKKGQSSSVSPPSTKKRQQRRERRSNTKSNSRKRERTNSEPPMKVIPATKRARACKEEITDHMIMPETASETSRIELDVSSIDSVTPTEEVRRGRGRPKKPKVCGQKQRETATLPSTPQVCNSERSRSSRKVPHCSTPRKRCTPSPVVVRVKVEVPDEPNQAMYAFERREATKFIESFYRSVPDNRLIDFHTKVKKYMFYLQDTDSSLIRSSSPRL